MRQKRTAIRLVRVTIHRLVAAGIDSLCSIIPIIKGQPQTLVSPIGHILAVTRESFLRNLSRSVICFLEIISDIDDSTDMFTGKGQLGGL